jgi:hypothetical protein
VLGWQSLFLQQGDGNRVEAAMTAIATVPDSEALVVGHLVRLTALDARIEGAYDRLRASVVGPITLNSAEIGQLKSEARRICHVIAAILGVTVPSCKYGGGMAGGEILQG